MVCNYSSTGYDFYFPDLLSYEYHSVSSEHNGVNHTTANSASFIRNVEPLPRLTDTLTQGHRYRWRHFHPPRPTHLHRPLRRPKRKDPAQRHVRAGLRNPDVSSTPRDPQAIGLYATLPRRFRPWSRLLYSHAQPMGSACHTACRERYEAIRQWRRSESGWC